MWVYAQIFAQEASFIKEGQAVQVTAPAFPSKTFHGTIKAVDTILNPETRSLRARALVPNPEGLLKPEMFVNAVIDIPLGRALAVPDEAVMNTGTRSIAFVLTSPGRYEPREVRVGKEADGYVEVVAGLKEGDAVVAAANFLIDSESKLKAALEDQGHD